MDTGTLADWLTAVIAIAALLASIVAWRTSVRMLQVEEERDKKNEIAETRKQAVAVFGWGILLTQRPAGQCWSIVLQNSSNEPVFNVLVESQRADGSKANAPLRLNLLPPGKYVMPSNPQYHWGSPIDFTQSPEPHELIAKGKFSMVTKVEFTDSHGRRWSIDEHRRISRVEPATQAAT